MKFKNHSGGFGGSWKKIILCFMAAVAVYAIMNFAGASQRTITMPLEIIMPKGFKVSSLVPQKADVVIKGSEKQIYMIDVSKIRLLADFSNVEETGVASAAVQINCHDLQDYIDISDISIYTKPSIVKMFFEQ